MSEPRQRLLIIDENPEVHDQLSGLLASFGYETSSAHSFQQGLDLVQSAVFDLVLMELDFPKADLDGFDLLRRLTELRPGLPVFIASHQSDIRRCVRCLESGAREYLMKPIEAEALFAALNRTFQSRKIEQERTRLLDQSTQFHEAITVYQKATHLLKIEDFDELLDTALDMFIHEANGLGAVIWIQDRPPKGPLGLQRVRGLIDVASEPNPWAFDSMTAALGQKEFLPQPLPFFAPGKAGRSDRQTIWIGMKVAGDRHAMVKISEPAESMEFEAAAVDAARLVAEFLHAALSGHYRMRRVEKKALEAGSAVTYNLYYFSDLVNKEIHKSQRYSRFLSMIHLRIDNHAALREHFGEADFEETMARITEAIRTTLRDADFLGRGDETNYFFLLPETDFFGSIICIQRLRNAIRGLTYLHDDIRSLPLQVKFASATFPRHGRTFAELKVITDQRLEDLKSSVYERMSLADRHCRQIIERLTGPVEAYASIEQYLQRLRTEFSEPPLVLDAELEISEDAEGMSRHAVMEEREIVALFNRLAQDIRHHPLRRGILYIGHPSIDSGNAILSAFKGIKKSETRVFLLGKVQAGVADWLGQELTLVSLKAEEIRPFVYAVFLNEDYVYAAVMRHEGGKRYYGLHTADPILIENLVGKIQSEYVLQKGI